MMRILIVDDDMSSAKALADKLAQYEDTELIGMAHTGVDGLRMYRESSPDLMFLDVELPDVSGLDFLACIDAVGMGNCRVVMYTAHSRYMLPAFRSRAFDYLVKPIDDAELRGIMRRACIDYRLVSSTQATRQPSVAEMAVDDDSNGEPRRCGDDRFMIYTNNNDFRIVSLGEIGVFTYNCEQRQWELLSSVVDEPIKLRRNVNSDMILALDDSLVRISQSQIINIAYLMEVVDNTCRFYPPFDSLNDVKVGRFYRKRLIDRFCGL